MPRVSVSPKQGVGGAREATAVRGCSPQDSGAHGQRAGPQEGRQTQPAGQGSTTDSEAPLAINLSSAGDPLCFRTQLLDVLGAESHRHPSPLPRETLGHPHLSGSHLGPPFLVQSLAHSRCSISACWLTGWMDEATVPSARWSCTPIPRFWALPACQIPSLSIFTVRPAWFLVPASACWELEVFT